MKKRKWYQAIMEYLSAKHYQSAKKRASLEKVLATLQVHREELERRLSDEKNARRRKHIEKALKVVAAQEKKGQKALRALDKEK